ncbi:hypothetical protein H5410_054288 [Solanum commersonii]|uniref:Uncharacterized protein n=1 Tax=Solanum commersonii TaxID=4109 RepID=A0A9J5X859_SOLCO|nr:hypothetical protein H5410_054288 [Solanum commersonii]
MESIEIKKRETTQDISVLKLPDSDSQTLTNKDGTTVSSENKTKKKSFCHNSFRREQCKPAQVEIVTPYCTRGTTKTGVQNIDQKHVKGSNFFRFFKYLSLNAT